MTELLRDVVLVSILAGMIRAATPILFAAIGELITQRAGIWNMGVEGTMLTGAFAAYLVVTTTGSIATAVLAAILAGGAMSLIVAFMTVTLRLDHFVTGLGLNLLASGLTLFWFRSYTEGREPPTFTGFQTVAVPGLSELPFLGPVLFQQHGLTYLALLMVPLVWFVLFRTKHGLEIRCLGENPKVLDAKGVGVETRQYLAVVFGGCMTGLGGAFLMLALSDRFLPEVAAGRGWLAIVAIIAGNWMPGRTLLAVLGFALFDSVATHAQAIGLQIPYQFLLMMPYVVSIVAVVIFRSRARQPAALGVPYHRA